MNTLICAGGTGLRVLESILHLCASGLGPKSMRILAIDPDSANGNGGRTKRLLDVYIRCREALAGKTSEEVPWFGTELDLLETVKGRQELAVWSPVAAGDKLRDVLKYDVLESTATPPEITQLLFTNNEMNATLDEGFRGHPVIGAAAMSLLPLHVKEPPWGQLIEKIKGDLDQKDCRVVIVGSVFGGTGASAIFPLARFLKEYVAKNDKNMKIGLVAMVPYFRFSSKAPASGTPSDDNTEFYAKSERFSLATRAAVEFYDFQRKNEDWHYGGAFWLGDQKLAEVEYAPGSRAQENPAHFVELLAAMTCLDYFKQPTTAGACYYSGPTSTETSESQISLDQNLLDWTDIPLKGLLTDEIRTQILSFFVAGATHIGFLDPLLRKPDLDQQFHCIPWYYDRFVANKNSLMTQSNQESLRALAEFYKHFYFPWWWQILDIDSADVRLINRQAFVERSESTRTLREPDLRKLTNYMYPDKPDRTSPDHFDAFFTDMVQVPRDKLGGRDVGAFISLLAGASSAFVRREYKREDK